MHPNSPKLATSAGDWDFSAWACGGTLHHQTITLNCTFPVFLLAPPMSNRDRNYRDRDRKEIRNQVFPSSLLTLVLTLCAPKLCCFPQQPWFTTFPAWLSAPASLAPALANFSSSHHQCSTHLLCHLGQWFTRLILIPSVIHVAASLYILSCNLTTHFLN